MRHIFPSLTSGVSFLNIMWISVSTCPRHVVSIVIHSGRLAGEMLWSVSWCLGSRGSSILCFQGVSPSIWVINRSSWWIITSSVMFFWLHQISCLLCLVVYNTACTRYRLRLYWEVFCQDEVVLSPDITTTSSLRLQFQIRIFADC